MRENRERRRNGLPLEPCAFVFVLLLVHVLALLLLVSFPFLFLFVLVCALVLRPVLACACGSARARALARLPVASCAVLAAPRAGRARKKRAASLQPASAAGGREAIRIYI